MDTCGNSSTAKRTKTDGINTEGSKKRNSQVVWQEEKETGEEQEQPIKLSVCAGGVFRV